MFSKNYSGNKSTYIEIYKYLVKEGFQFSENTKPIHLGKDVYEFTEDTYKNNKLGCHNIYKIKAYKENKEVTYKKVSVGFICND